MKRTWLVLIPTIVLSLAGAGVSFNLMVKHERKSTGFSWFDSTCEGAEEEESTRSCDEVMASKWGMFPPVPEGVAPERENDPVPLPLPMLRDIYMQPRPVGLFGLFYFSAMAVWYLVVGRPNHRRRFWHLVPLLLNITGVAGALFFAYIMFFTDLEVWCPWCMVAHGINALMLVGAILMWPRRPAIAVLPQAPMPVHEPSAVGLPEAVPGSIESAGTGQVGEIGDTPETDAEVEPAAPSRTAAVAGPVIAAPAGAPPVAPPPVRLPAPHPTFRLVLAAVVGIAAVVVAEWYYHDYTQESRDRVAVLFAAEQCKEEIEKVQGHAKTLYSMYQQEEKHEIPIREDDPIKNAGSDRLSAVVFSDFLCPYCGRFAKYMRDVVEPMFGENLRVTFKHYPADTPCNKYMRSRFHPHACKPSQAAEAARILGGNDMFWQVHDLLFDSPKAQLALDAFYIQLAEQLGFDPNEFAEVMDSEEVQARIAEDIEVAKDVGLRGTPAVYLSGRHVPSLAREQEVFWQEVKRRYDILLKSRQQKRAERKQGEPNHEEGDSADAES